jgi:hypothetical protein
MDKTLRNEMISDMQILAREIGEKSVNISNLIANGGEGWKGRAQQILALQEKVCKL